MTFVDAHQAAFADHGFCARAEAIRNSTAQCFSPKGESFDPDIVNAASQPMLCGRSAGEYRAYLPRARWIRDANDSYFAAMTYPQGLPSSSSPPTSTTRPGACCRRSMAAPCIRPPKATPRWRTRRCRAATSVLQLINVRSRRRAVRQPVPRSAPQPQPQ